MTAVAVLCADRSSVYRSIAGVEVFDAARDARTFAGDMPVVAHPPCRAWSAHCRHQAKPAPGEADLGPLCVEFVRQCGGVLEHPAHSRLWIACNLPMPGRPPVAGVWSLEVRQGWWDHQIGKKTWLLISGVSPADLPPIPFKLRDSRGDLELWNRMSKRKRSATPPAFARWLVDVALTTRRA